MRYPALAVYFLGLMPGCAPELEIVDPSSGSVPGAFTINNTAGDAVDRIEVYDHGMTAIGYLDFDPVLRAGEMVVVILPEDKWLLVAHLVAADQDAAYDVANEDNVSL